MAAGEVIKILATDPSTSWDFDNFCRFMNHEMLAKTESETGYQYWIKKG
jgi:tRNA 2-thiouridine synthesizing protein A